jgi:uncharacterized protein (DUF433 family)
MNIEAPDFVDLRKYVETRIFGDRPHIRGRRIPVVTVAHYHQRQGWSIVQLAENFGLSEAEVLAALLYYEENKLLIETQEAAYQAELDAAYQRYGND